MAECSQMVAGDYLGLLSTAKDRKKFIARLAHSDLLDPRFVHLIDPQEQTIDAIEDQLRERGAPATCYVISEDPRLDRRRMPLRGTLEATVGSGMATFLSCIVGRLAYFEGEEPARVTSANERLRIVEQRTATSGFALRTDHDRPTLSASMIEIALIDFRNRLTARRSFIYGVRGRGILRSCVLGEGLRGTHELPIVPGR